VRCVGDETFRICRELVDDMVIVDTDEICAAIQDVFEDTRTIVEPAGALSVAGLKHYVAAHAVQGRTLVAVNCGANVNFDRLRHIAERAALGEQREALFAVEIPERPGSFLAFCEALGKRNITEFNYRLQASDTAHIFVGVELRRGADERHEISAMLGDAGYPVIDLKVTLVDGSYHDVDSSEMAFKIAGSMAMREGVLKASPVLLEPTMKVEVEAPEDFLGDVMGDLNSRRGHIEGMGSEEGITKVTAKVPLAEMFGYATDIRSKTQGRGIFSMEFSHYEEVPRNVAEAIIAKNNGNA